MFGKRRRPKPLDEQPDPVTSSLEEGLASIRDKLNNTYDTAKDASRGVSALQLDVQRLYADIARLREAVEGLRAGSPENHAAVTPDSTEDDFDELLALAAGIAYAEITCHRDTWDFLVTQSSGGQHFRLPGFVEETDCLINADVSGRTLIAVLDALWRTRHDPATDPGTRHLATKIYGRIGDALRQIEASEPEPGRSARFCRDDPPVAHIVIDDRPAAEANS